jgi:hypothetical protein
MPVQHSRDRQLVPKCQFQVITSLEADRPVRRRVLERPYGGIGLSRSQGDDAGSCLERQGGPIWGGSDPRQGRIEERRTRSGQEFAPVGAEKSVCHSVDPDHFLLDMSSSRRYLR